MNVIQLVASSGFITVNKIIAKEFGIDAAVFLGEIASTQVYWEAHNGLDENGMFFETAEQITENTTLTTYQQGKASKVLEDAGLLKSKRKGVPAKKFYAVDSDGLEVFFKNKFLKNLETRVEKIEKLDSQFFGNINKKREIKKREIRKDNKDIVLESSLSDPLKEKLIDFLSYRQEIKKPFKSEKAIESLVAKVEKQEQTFGTSAVIQCIDMTFENQWTGIIWDKIKKSSDKELRGADAFFAAAMEEI